MASEFEQQNKDQGVVVLAPGSEQFPAPRRGDPPTHCTECGAEMMFNSAYLADGGTWTCNCEAGRAQQSRQLKWFAVMIFCVLDDCRHGGLIMALSRPTRVSSAHQCNPASGASVGPKPWHAGSAFGCHHPHGAVISAVSNSEPTAAGCGRRRFDDQGPGPAPVSELFPYDLDVDSRGRVPACVLG